MFEKACGDLWGQSMIVEVISGNSLRLEKGWGLHHELSQNKENNSF